VLDIERETLPVRTEAFRSETLSRANSSWPFAHVDRLSALAIDEDRHTSDQTNEPNLLHTRRIGQSMFPETIGISRAQV
jgi:hypothetical protein